MKNIAGFKKLTTKEVEDMEPFNKPFIEETQRLSDKYNQLLIDNGLNPLLYEPIVTILPYNEDDFKNNLVTVMVEAKPIKLVGGIPINQITFED